MAKDLLDYIRPYPSIRYRLDTMSCNMPELLITTNTTHHQGSGHPHSTNVTCCDQKVTTANQIRKYQAWKRRKWSLIQEHSKIREIRKLEIIVVYYIS